MKLLAPLRHSSEVEPLVHAGADEFYCGLTPPGWAQLYPQSWVNRRSPQSANVADLADFAILLKRAAGHPVYVALNAPFYPAGSMALLTEFGRTLLGQGAAGLIVADLELLLALVDAGLASSIHLSSLATCTNSDAARFYQELGLARIILPRHLTLSEIADCLLPDLEFEVFLLNDGCTFEEGLCATTHAAGVFCLADGANVEQLSGTVRENYDLWKWTLNHCGCKTHRGYPLGPCGLCALPRLKELGIRSLKVVGREASLARKISSVRLARLALNLAHENARPAQIREAVMDLRGAKSLCQSEQLCYYPDIWRKPQTEDSLCSPQ